MGLQLILLLITFLTIDGARSVLGYAGNLFAFDFV